MLDLVDLIFVYGCAITEFQILPFNNSRRARVRFWLWITKVSGPTKTLHILNAGVVLITSIPPQHSKYVVF